MQTVGGNTALALLLTVSSNLLGIFTMPFLLCRLLGAAGSAVSIQPAPLLSNLLKTILLPLLGGALVRATIPGQFPSLVPKHATSLIVQPHFESSTLPLQPYIPSPPSPTPSISPAHGLHRACLVSTSAAKETSHTRLTIFKLRYVHML